MRDLIEQLVRTRRAQGITLTHLAARIGRPANQMSTWETGAGFPSLPTLTAWATALGYTLTLTPDGTPQAARLPEIARCTRTSHPAWLATAGTCPTCRTDADQATITHLNAQVADLSAALESTRQELAAAQAEPHAAIKAITSRVRRGETSAVAALGDIDDLAGGLRIRGRHAPAPSEAP
jgi:transcriptional regulator with XRE-family HTH domain